MKQNFFSPGMDTPLIHMHASTLCCFNGLVSNHTIRRALTALVDSCVEIKSALSMVYPFNGVPNSGRVWRMGTKQDRGKAMLGVCVTSTYTTSSLARGPLLCVTSVLPAIPLSACRCILWVSCLEAQQPVQHHLHPSPAWCQSAATSASPPPWSCLVPVCCYLRLTSTPVLLGASLLLPPPLLRAAGKACRALF